MIKEITLFEFNNFTQNLNLEHNFYQSVNNAILSSEEGYDYDYIGYFENGLLLAVALILIKKITVSYKYGYAPRGFILDYNDAELIKKFSNALKKYYTRRKLVFIKIDPFIPLRVYDNKLNIISNNENNCLDLFESLNYKKLKNNLYFESQLPRFECIINLKNYNLENVSKNTRNKIKKALKKGLTLEKVSVDKIQDFYKFVKSKKEKSFDYYNNLYKIFSKDDMIDLFLVKTDYEIFMDNAKKNYENELVENGIYNENLKYNNTKKNLNKKLISDKLLVTYKNDIMEASRKYSDNELSEYIAGAIVIKMKNEVYILSSGYNQMYRHLNANYYLLHSLIEHYKDDYEKIIFNGFTGDFSQNNYYYGLNKFKMGFNPQIIEYIGELDFILNEKVYNNLLLTGKLHKELDKKINPNHKN